VFFGWNKRGIMNHIVKVAGLKNGIFKLYADTKREEFRSIWYHEMLDTITAVYQIGFIEDTEINLVSVEALKNLNLKQFRIRTAIEYLFVTAGVNVQIGQLTRILRFKRMAIIS
jgi:hypothetical protein